MPEHLNQRQELSFVQKASALFVKILKGDFGVVQSLDLNFEQSMETRLEVDSLLWQHVRIANRRTETQTFKQNKVIVKFWALEGGVVNHFGNILQIEVRDFFGAEAKAVLRPADHLAT